MSIVIAAFEAPLQGTGLPTVADDRGCHHTLFEAVAADAPFAAIDIAQCDSDENAAGLVRAYRSMVPSARAGRYEVIDVGGRPAADEPVGGAQQPLTFVNCFQVDPGREEEALVTWREFNRYFVVKPGYISHRLHRGDDDASFRYVNVVRWESAEAWAAAHDAGFRDMAARPLPFVSLPTLCRPAPARVQIGTRS